MRLYKTQYSFRISGNRGYDSNRVRFSIDSYINVWLRFPLFGEFWRAKSKSTWSGISREGELFPTHRFTALNRRKVAKI